MRTIIKAAPIRKDEVEMVDRLEKEMATAQGLWELKRKTYYQAMEGLLQKYDPNHKINRANQANVYRGEIKDGILVITLE